MSLICGIYGYEITQPFSACGMHFVPRFTSFREAQDAARDLERYNLTAVVHAERFSGDALYRLEAILSFIEHLDVVITEPVPKSEDGGNQFAQVLTPRRRHNGGGAVIGSDAFFRSSRPTFIEKSFARLGDSAHCNATGYRTLFFKAAETFRQRRPFLEVSYFLLFSGLETYVRKTLGNPDTREIAVLLNRRLRALGFTVFNFRSTELERSMDTYARLRNALFHSSEFQAQRRTGGSIITYDLETYYAQFLLLVRLVVLKATDFDDGHINWDSWIDRQPLK